MPTMSTHKQQFSSSSIMVLVVLFLAVVVTNFVGAAAAVEDDADATPVVTMDPQDDDHRSHFRDRAGVDVGAGVVADEDGKLLHHHHRGQLRSVVAPSKERRILSSSEDDSNSTSSSSEDDVGGRRRRYHRTLLGDGMAPSPEKRILSSSNDDDSNSTSSSDDVRRGRRGRILSSSDDADDDSNSTTSSSSDDVRGRRRRNKRILLGDGIVDVVSDMMRILHDDEESGSISSSNRLLYDDVVGDDDDGESIFSLSEYYEDDDDGNNTSTTTTTRPRVNCTFLRILKRRNHCGRICCRLLRRFCRRRHGTNHTTSDDDDDDEMMGDDDDDGDYRLLLVDNDEEGDPKPRDEETVPRYKNPCQRVFPGKGTTQEGLELCANYEALHHIIPDCTNQESMVPKIFHSIGSSSEQQYHQVGITLTNPTYKRNHHNDTSAIQYIQEHCGQVVADAYTCLKPTAFRADLFRFCALYSEGGVYLDDDLVPLYPLEELYSPCSVATIGYDIPFYGRPGKQMKLLAAAPGAPIFHCAMNQIVHNVRVKAHPESSLEVTGPFMLQHCYEQHSENVAITYSDTRPAIWPYTGMRVGNKVLAYEMPPNNSPKKKNSADQPPPPLHYSILYEQNDVFTDSCPLSEKNDDNKDEDDNDSDTAIDSKGKLDNNSMEDSLASAAAEVRPTKSVPMKEFTDRHSSDSYLPQFEIPRQSFVVWKTEQLNKDAIPLHEEWLKKEPTLSRRIVTDDECRDLASKYPGLLEGYDAFPKNVMRADTCRLLAVFFYGGIYMDIDVAWTKPLDDWFDFQASSRIQVGNETEDHYCNWFFGATKGHPCIASALDLIAERSLAVDMSNEHFVHDHTGPAIFTEGLKRCAVMPSWSRKDMEWDNMDHQYGSQKWRYAEDYVSWADTRFEPDPQNDNKDVEPEPKTNVASSKERRLLDLDDEFELEDRLPLHNPCNRVDASLGATADQRSLCETYEALPYVLPDCDDQASIVPRIYHSVSRDEVETTHQLATRLANPTFARNHHSDSSGWDYVYDKCGVEAADAYSCLNPGAFRADLFRFCALYAEGGVYLDGDIVPLVPLEELYSPCSSASIGHDLPQMGHSGKQMKILAGSPGAAIFKCAIDKIIENVRDRAQFDTSLELTGPFMLHNCYEAHPEDVAITYHDTRNAMWPHTGMRRGDRILAYEIPNRNKHFPDTTSSTTKPASDDYQVLFQKNEVFSDSCPL